jgi:hypothetical protein
LTKKNFKNYIDNIKNICYNLTIETRKQNKFKGVFKMLKFTVIAGLNDKETKTQIISTETAYKIIFKTLKNNGVEGATLTEALGFYTHNNGEEVIEKSIKIELLFIERITAVKIAKDLRTALNQESVVLEVAELESELIEG